MRKSLLRLTLRQLQVFRAVCETRSYSRAAEEMALTQPAVSLQIRQLEEVVGQPLFEYLGKTLYLTPAAEALVQANRDIFGRLESLDMQLADLQGSLQGQLNLTIESSAKYFIPHLFAAFRQTYPEVSLQLTVINHGLAVKRLGTSRDDLLIMSNVPTNLALEFFPFLNYPIVAVAPPEHPLLQTGPLSLQNLCAWPLLIREQGSATRKACEEFFDQKRAHFTQTLEIGSTEAQREAVCAGLGLALLPRHAIYRELASGALVELPVAELPLMRSWCVVHTRGKRLSPVAQTFFTYIREQRSAINALAERFSKAPSLPPTAY